MAKEKKKVKDDWIIPAGLFIGLGVGFITGNIVGYLLIGLGLGFLVAYLGRNRK